MDQDKLHLLDGMFDMLQVGIVILDAHGTIEWVNRAFTKITGCTMEQVKGKNPCFLKSGMWEEAFYRQMWQQLTSTGYWEGAIGNKRPNDKRCLHYLRVIANRDPDGTVTNYIGIVTDIAVNKEINHSPRENTRLLEAIVEASPMGIIALSTDGYVKMWNVGAERIYGWKKEEVLNQPCPLVLDGLREEVEQTFTDASCTAVPSTGLEVQRKRKDGSLVWVSQTTARLFDDQNNVAGLITFHEDITLRKQTEEQIRHLAYHDDLTGLPNRRSFKDKVQSAITRANQDQKMLGVLSIDIDEFKKINDSLGHRYGDPLLKELAKRIRQCVREQDVVARIGGDAFGVLLADLDYEQDVINVCETIMEAIKRPISYMDYAFHLTASIGVALYPYDGASVEELMKNADTALYRVKDTGDAYELYAPKMNEGAWKRLNLETELHHALEKEEFVVFYQPQIDLRDGRLVGVEALVRWMHPKWGLIPPGKFISLCEETGMIIPLGDWVLRTACEQVQDWRKQGFTDLTVAVNLSIRQFMKNDLIDSIKRILESTGLPPGCLELEITESMAMDISRAILTLQRLKQLGVQIGIDDFGTGYSSLNYLKNLPIDKLKIDQSFVRDLSVEGNNRPIVSTIITLAHNLRLRVIAEGVEEEEQLAFLSQHGCDLVQGYFISRPLPADEFYRTFLAPKSTEQIRHVHRRGRHRTDHDRIDRLEAGDAGGCH